MPHRNAALPVEERFETKVDRSGECHRWTGARHGKGYGHFRYKGKIRKAHVVALLLAGVKIPDGMTVDHVWARGCRFKDCVRVDHLEVVPGPVNTLRGNNPCAINARKTHCIRGHEFTPETTRVNSHGTRNCRVCINELNRAKRLAARPMTCALGHPKVVRQSDGKAYCPPCHSAARRKAVA